jgi:hypothetical protein
MRETKVSPHTPSFYKFLSKNIIKEGVLGVAPSAQRRQSRHMGPPKTIIKNSSI